jgi:hypothetical protein
VAHGVVSLLGGLGLRILPGKTGSIGSPGTTLARFDSVLARSGLVIIFCMEILLFSHFSA